jgi:glycolate oxidase FAD binding subunit
VSLKTDQPHIQSTLAPATGEELIEQLRACHARTTPVYPIGGATALDYGIPAKQPGVAISLAGLNRVIDYPARDMTVTVEAGVTLASLNEQLAAERQQLPFDVPDADQATVGGIVATNWNGCRRYGYGSVRDYVIGIHAVDGTGLPFKGGGRVVKNVAGYDFCKLLTGSLGTLGVIDQLTFRLRPIPESRAWVGCWVANAELTERLLQGLVHSETSPTAIELVAGPDWNTDARLASLRGRGTETTGGFWLLVGVEGTSVEVDWMVARLREEWHAEGVNNSESWQGDLAKQWLADLTNWSCRGAAGLVLKASVRPSGVVPMLAAFAAIDPRVSLQAHAGNGQIIARYPEFPAGGMSRTVVGRLQAEASQWSGSLTVVSNPSGQEMTLRSVWGVGGVNLEMMQSVKRQFDPKNLLNPGRFVFA